MKHLIKNIRNYKSLQRLLITQIRSNYDATQNSMFEERPLALLTDEMLDSLEQNVLLRRHRNNVPLIRQLTKRLRNDTANSTLSQQLQNELQRLPNVTHPRLLDYENEPRELLNYVHKQVPHKAKEFSEICKAMNLFRMDHLGNYTGHKSYYLLGQLASLEQAIIDYALRTVTSHGFKIISVPDILPKEVIENCGMRTDGERTQVYKLENGKCLSGTSEMALAGFFTNRVIDETNLPIKVTAISRCYRAETSGLHEEKGIYRVHQFNKVEMFAICAPHQSATELEQFKDIQVSLFKQLGINFRLLDMPPCELGAPAYQKYDIEAWMAGRQMWGEISSCSNCTDYQAKRLNIKYRSAKDGIKRYVHTINGTATAIPRLLIALLESNQCDVNDSVDIPEVLAPYMGSNKITKNRLMPETKLVKFIKVQ